VIDETGFLKQGKRSCGVKRQYSGTAGKVENCQIDVFLTYASTKGHTPIDRRLYSPKDWLDDRERCKKAKIPETVAFQTKPELALEMMQNATSAGVPYSWVVGDCVYGDYDVLRLWLEEYKKGYVLCVSGKEYLQINKEEPKVLVGWFCLKFLNEVDWFLASCGDGSKGARVYVWWLLNMSDPSVGVGSVICLFVKVGLVGIWWCMCVLLQNWLLLKGWWRWRY
jgi:hypothetical protein